MKNINYNVDILIDLSGFTHCRCFSLFYKPAPVQMQYLGFVNTMGMKDIDYIFADDYTIPKDMAKYYTEKPLYLNTLNDFVVKCCFIQIQYLNPVYPFILALYNLYV